MITCEGKVGIHEGVLFNRRAFAYLGIRLDIKARAQIGGKMEIPEIMCYVGRIVQVVLKNGDYHIGLLDYHTDNIEIGMTVLLWPLFLIMFLFVAIIELPSLFYKGLMILLTTIVYVIKALAGKGDGDGSTDNSTDNH